MEIQFRIRTAKIRKYSRAVFLLFSTALLSITFAQSQSLSQEEFNQGIIKAYNNNRSTIADSLIKNNRLLVKPFVNSLITGCIESELKGKVKDASNLQAIASRAAESFEKIFSEKSLTIGVNYLTAWTIEQKKKKIVADSSYAVRDKIKNRQRKDKSPSGT